MKKILCFLFVCLFGCLCVGCDSAGISDVLSEKTEIYYVGNGEKYQIELAVGERENPYIMDGISHNRVGFSLITLNLSQVESNIIQASLIINGEDNGITLELNPLNMLYMADLGYALKGNETVEFCYGDERIVLNQVSGEFKVDCQKAIKIGYDNIDEKQMFQNDGGFVCEGYLKVINGKKFGHEGLYWCFTLINQMGDIVNILINTLDENDIIKN